MSIETLTGDEFMHLDAATHRVALSQYEAAIDAATVELAGNGPHNTNLFGEQRATLLDRLGSLLQLRKLHRTRLEELEEDERPLLASEQYRLNELSSVPS